MSFIANTTHHINNGLIINPFGTDGAIHLTPITGDQTERCLILDATSARALRDLLIEITA